MLDTAGRQLANAPAGDAAELVRLRALLGADDSADLPTLNQRLAAAIASGTCAADHPGLAAHLWATTLAKLAVDQPGYDTYQRQLQYPGKIST